MFLPPKPDHEDTDASDVEPSKPHTVTADVCSTGKPKGPPPPPKPKRLPTGCDVIPEEKSRDTYRGVKKPDRTNGQTDILMAENTLYE